MDTFAECSAINDLIYSGDEATARDRTITLLDNLRSKGEPYSPLVNSIIRSVGLYPYLDGDTCDWIDRYAIEAFSSDVGGQNRGVLHREQSRLLGKLLSGHDIAVSAPTSFGKSFVIDAFIATKSPATVMILVPTIALMDETRRRIQSKFGSRYKIITSSDQELSDRTIFIFPQERALGYIDKIESIDLLVVDEFYKAGRVGKFFDGERSSALIQAIVGLSSKCLQRYFLAPNVSELEGVGIFGGDIEFIKIDFNTVFLRKHDLHAQIGRDDGKRGEALIRILSTVGGKSLVYAGTYTNINKISLLINEKLPKLGEVLLSRFSEWLAINYSPTWELVSLARRGVGVHNGSLHRSLAQIQVMLFERTDGLNIIVSTSSIIEGVNTSAENVILWSNKSGVPKIDDFTYKNIIGRGGRMFRHFIGNIYILDRPPREEGRQLELGIPEEMLGTFDEAKTPIALTAEQTLKISAYREK
ncbi:DEAD/DEAH box helicase, partial [bacterium]|nr:DEAD/DEAH box helicase [bacterium]